MDLRSIVTRTSPPSPWAEGENIPWDDPHKANIPALAKSWKAAVKWFMRFVHTPTTRESNDPPAKEIEEQFESFESVLMVFVREFFDSVEDLDEVLDKANRG